jgi:periplasmic protein TonB
VATLQLSSLNLPHAFQRALVAATILVGHAAVLYLGITFAPAASRVITGTLSAHFVQASIEPRPEWQPPKAQPLNIELNVPAPVAPPIEVAIEAPSAVRQTAPLYVARSTPPPAEAGNRPRLISAVEYVREPVPRYPPQSRRLKEQGLVVLRVLIDEKGQACDIEIESSSGHVRLDHAAKDAVARAMFRPYVEDGAPRRALVLIPIEFSLNSGSA